jgi:hypothetical protein
MTIGERAKRPCVLSSADGQKNSEVESPDVVDGYPLPSLGPSVVYCSALLALSARQPEDVPSLAG